MEDLVYKCRGNSVLHTSVSWWEVCDQSLILLPTLAVNTAKQPPCLEALLAGKQTNYLTSIHRAVHIFQWENEKQLNN